MLKAEGENKGVGSGLENHPPHADADGGRDDMTTPTSKRTTAPAFQFYPSDFLNSPKVRRMSLTERGAYITLLSLCWMDGGSLTTDLAELASELHVPSKQFERMWAGPLGKCFYEKSGRLRNERLDREKKKQDEYRQRQSDAATRKWDRKRVSQADAVASPPQKLADALQSSSSSTSSSTSSEKRKTKTPIGPRDEWFQTLYEHYPSQRRNRSRVTTGLFNDEFNNDDRPDESIWSDMWQGLQSQIAGYEWRVKGMVPAMDKWLSEGRWRQRHDAAPVSALVSEKTARNLTAMEQFIKAGGR